MPLRRASVGSCLFALLASQPGLFGAQAPKAPVPKSPYLPVIYHYADTLLERGRDNFGPQKTGLFLSALDRMTLAPLTNRPAAPEGVREADRVGSQDQALTGANLQHDENLLRLLYMLSELSGKSKYREAADAALKWFIQNAQPAATHLLPWGQYRFWDALKDEAIVGNGASVGTPEFFRPWLLWDRCFEVAAIASKQAALDVWPSRIENHNTGTSGHPMALARRLFPDRMGSPRQAGFCIRTWAVAYAHTKDTQFLEAIEALLEQLQRTRDPKAGAIETDGGNASPWPISTLSLCIDCDGAAHRVPEPLRTRLKVFASRADEIFCTLSHEVPSTGGFVMELRKGASEPPLRRTPLWAARYRSSTTAQVGMMCVSRYDNTGRTGYRDLFVAAADAYADSLPAAEADVWPMAFGQAISLQLAAWRHTARWGYFERARGLADLALTKFFQGSSLPRASAKSDHYESLTGADTLALALVELHLNVLHITAVRCPPNTIDR